MKKLIALVAVLLLAVVANFGLWFFHTRTINNFIVTVDKRISSLGGEFKYDEVVFDTFKSWSVQGAIIKPKIMFKDKLLKQNLEIEIGRINFSSLPFDGKITFTYSEESVFKITSENNVIKTMRILHADEANSDAEIVFYSSLRELLNIINDDQKQSIFKALKSFSFSSGKVNIIDEVRGEYFNLDGIKIKVNGNAKNNNLTYDFLFDLKNGKYSKEYKVDDSEKALYNNLKSMGSMNVIIDFTYSQWQSKKQQDFINAAKESKDIELKPVIDSNKISLKSLDYKTDLFAIKIGGDFETESNDATTNFQISVHKYDGFFNLVFNYLNYYIDLIKSQSISGFFISRIDEVKTKKVKLFFKQFAISEDDINIKIIKDKNQGLTISGKSWPEVLMQLQSIFASSQDGDRKKDLRLAPNSSQNTDISKEKKAEKEKAIKKE